MGTPHNRGFYIYSTAIFCCRDSLKSIPLFVFFSLVCACRVCTQVMWAYCLHGRCINTTHAIKASPPNSRFTLIDDHVRVPSSNAVPYISMRVLPGDTLFSTTASSAARTKDGFACLDVRDRLHVFHHQHDAQPSNKQKK